MLDFEEGEVKCVEYIGWKIGQQLRNLRKNSGMTLEELSAKVDKSTSHINQIELGSRKMTMNLLFSVMKVLEVDANTVLVIPQKEVKEQVSIDAMLTELPQDAREDLIDTFKFMIKKMLRKVG